MKIYTQKGDGGNTSFYTGESVRKNDPRIEAVGTIDELNSLIGLVLSQVGVDEKEQNSVGVEIKSALERIQHDLFTVGAELTMLSTKKMSSSFKMPMITTQHISDVERMIDGVSEKLVEQKSFLLPGGTMLSAWLHFSRTVTRRAEREVVGLMEHIEMNPEVLRYLNRLSDLLYVLARYANKETVSEQQPMYKYFG
jgi:cob(I)alamin adenosyltransferase